MGGLQADLALPYTAGSGRRYDPGSAGGGVLYNLDRERGWPPAFAVAADHSTPIGPERRSAEVGPTGITTETLDPAMDRRLHLSVSCSWSRALDPNEEERRERDADIVEAGLRYRFTDAITPGVGAGFGIGRDSPRLRAIASLQIGFGGRSRP